MNKRSIIILFIAWSCAFTSLWSQWLSEDVPVWEPEELGITKEIQRTPTMEEVLALDEEFLYHVSYGFFHLGEVAVRLKRDTTYQGMPAYYLQTRMRANKNLMFVGYKEEHFNSFFTWDGEQLRQRYFYVNDLDDKIDKKIEYLFDYDSMKVISRFKGQPKDTLDLEEGASGGDIVFLLSRVFAYEGGGYNMPVYVNFANGPLDAKTTKIGEMRSYKAFEEKVPTIRSEGDAQFEGPFGFSGKFTSWFASDSTRIPLEAHARVWIGNVKVRLERYRRLN